MPRNLLNLKDNFVATIQATPFSFFIRPHCPTRSPIELPRKTADSIEGEVEREEKKLRALKSPVSIEGRCN